MSQEDDSVSPVVLFLTFLIALVLFSGIILASASVLGITDDIMEKEDPEFNIKITETNSVIIDSKYFPTNDYSYTIKEVNKTYTIPAESSGKVRVIGDYNHNTVTIVHNGEVVRTYNKED